MAVRLTICIAVLVLGACGVDESVGTAPTVGPEVIRFVVTVHDGVSNSDPAPAIHLERIGSSGIEVVRAIDLGDDKHQVDIDVSEAVSIDVVVDGEVVAAVDRSYWEGAPDGPIVVGLWRAGVLLKREVPPGCAEDVRCAGFKERQYIPAVVGIGMSEIEVHLRVKQDERRVLGGPIIIDEVPADGSPPHTIFNSGPGSIVRPITTDISAHRDSALRVAIGDSGPVTVPAEIWSLTWDRLMLNLSKAGLLVKVRTPGPTDLTWQTFDLPYDGAGA